MYRINNLIAQYWHMLQALETEYSITLDENIYSEIQNNTALLRQLCRE